MEVHESLNEASAPIVFIDTTVLKFSATNLLRFRPRQTKVEWGGKTIEVAVSDIEQVNPNDRIANPDLKAEADLLPKLAKLGTDGSVRYLMHMEVKLESWGLPSMDTEGGDFYSAPIDVVDGPMRYERVVVGGSVKAKDHRFRFLKSIDHPRFKELQRMTGAYQGANEPNRNQLVDAFHLWCAEHAGAEYFLTLDFTLMRVAASSSVTSPVRLVRPSELLVALGLQGRP